MASQAQLGRARLTGVISSCCRALPLVGRPQLGPGCSRQQQQQHWQQQQQAAAAARRVAARSAAGDVALDDIDWTEDMPAPVQRRVAALRDVQKSYDALMLDFIRERSELQAKYEKAAEPMLAKRAAIVAGEEEVPAGDVADSGEPDEGIPDFWLTAMSNHDMIGEYVTERDAEVLSYLADVRAATLTGEDAGSFRLEFRFRPNPHFSNEVLEKTFYMENPDEVVPDRFVGCTIGWAAGKDTTVEVVKTKAKAKKGAKAPGPALVVTKTKPCDSFFNFFRTPAVPESPEDLSDDDLEALQQQMDEDYEVATAFKDSLIPHAVEWFTGEIAPPMFDDFDEYGEEEEEDEGPAAPPPRGSRR